MDFFRTSPHGHYGIHFLGTLSYSSYDINFALYKSFKGWCPRLTFTSQRRPTGFTSFEYAFDFITSKPEKYEVF